MSEAGQAVILAGGRGTRLGALTETTPKPLLPVAGRPFLSHMVERLARQGFRDILLLTGYLAAQFETFRTEWQARGVRVTCRTEPEPAGTGGALRLAVSDLAPGFLLLNGDSLFDIDLVGFTLPALPAGIDGRLALRAVPAVDRYGVVTLDRGRVTGFREKGGVAGAGLINAGVYYLRRDVAAMMPPGFCSLETDLFPRLAAAGRLEGRLQEGYFLDIGIPSDLARAQLDFDQGGEACIS